MLTRSQTKGLEFTDIIRDQDRSNSNSNNSTCKSNSNMSESDENSSHNINRNENKNNMADPNNIHNDHLNAEGKHNESEKEIEEGGVQKQIKEKQNEENDDPAKKKKKNEDNKNEEKINEADLENYVGLEIKDDKDDKTVDENAKDDDNTETIGKTDCVTKSNENEKEETSNTLDELAKKSELPSDNNREQLEASHSIRQTFQFQFTSSLFVLGLFVVQEESLKDIIQPVVTELDSNTYVTNPVFFAPNVNHHPCTYEMMNNEFKASAYYGECAELHHRDIHVIAYNICDGKPTENTFDTPLQSLYVVEYMKKNKKWVNKEIIHGKKYARGIPASFIDNFTDKYNSNDSMQFVQTIFQKLSNKRLEKVSDVKAIAKEFSLENAESKEYANIHEAYSDVRKKFQQKFGIGIGIIEGNHRINLALRIIGNQLPTNAYHVDKELQKEKRIKNMNLKKSNFNQGFKINVYVPKVAIPKIEEMRQKSSEILSAQQEGFGTSLGDIFLECSKENERIMITAKSTDQGASKDMTMKSYYNENYKDPGFKFDGEVNGDDFKTFAQEFESTPKSAVSNPFFRKSGLVLPELLQHLVKYSHFQSSQIKLNNAKGNLSLSNTRYWILYGSMKNNPMVSAQELERLNPATNKTTPVVHLLVRGVLEFLRALLFTEDGRNLLTSYICLSSRGLNKWPQTEENGIFNYSKLHDENIVRFIMVCSLKIANKLLRSLKNKKIRKKPLLFILLQVYVKQILRDVLCIGQNPKINKLRLKSKVGNSYDSYFVSTKQDSFLVCALRYYSEYVEKYINSLFCFTQFTFCGFNDDKELELQMEKLTFSKQVMIIDTMDRTDVVRVQEKTTIPGSFFEFFVAIAGKIPDGKTDEYEKFYFTDPSDKKTAEKITKPSPTKKKKTDMFSSLQKHAMSLLTIESENDEEGTVATPELKLSEFVEKSLSAITESSNSKSPTLKKYISFIANTVKESVSDENQITMTFDDTKLKQVFEETGDDEENDSTDVGPVAEV